MRAAAIGLGLLSMGLATVGFAESLPATDSGPQRVVVTMVPEEMPTIMDIRIVGDEVPIPRNGSVLIFVRMDGWVEEEAVPIVQVSKTNGAETTTFGGELHPLGDYYWAWTPTVPLEVGDYSMTLAHPGFGTVTATVHIVADAVIEPPLFSSDPVAVLGMAITEYAVCQYWTGSELVEGAALPIRERNQAEVRANLAFSSEQPVVHQFLYRAVVPGIAAQLSASNLPLVAGPFTVQAPEYCFGLEALDITTGTVHPYPDLELCAPHGALPDLMERELEVTLSALNRYTCTVPPAGYEEPWCESNADCLDLSQSVQVAMSNYCHLYFETCPDAERPEPSAGTGGMMLDGGTAGADGGRRDAGFAPWFEQDDAAVDSDAGDDDDPGAVSHGSGCAVARRVSAVPASGGLWAALAALALSSARRRRRRRPARREA